MNKKNLQSTVYLFFLLSGMTGLIFQITWFKYLSLFLGNTTYAQIIVLATFLGGLALGNYFIGKVADRVISQLKIYGFIELIIGIYCIIFPASISFFENLFYVLINEDLLINQSFLFLLIKFFISALILLIPTILMGGTLPLLTKFFTDKIENVRKENASLYFINSFGAVVGIYFAGFVLIKAFGLDVTIRIAAIINLIIGSVSIVLSSFFNKEEKDELNTENSLVEKVNVNKFDKRLITTLIYLAGISGFASLMYEVLWTRVLISVFGSSTYSFSLMLMAFISGITIGSFVVSSNFISKINRINLLIFSQFMIAITTLISILLLPHLPYQFWKLSALFAKTNDAFPIFLSVEFLICFLLMFVPTIFMGMTLPLIVELVAQYKNLIGVSVGTVFSVNTFGNVLGALTAGLFFIPVFGVKNSFIIGIVINLIGATILLISSIKSLNRKSKFSFASLFASSILLMLIVPNWNVEIMTSGVFRRLSDEPPKTYHEYKRIFQTRELLFYKDGLSGNISVVRTLDTLNQRVLLINGKPDASSYGDMPTQLLLGHIPMFLHNNPKNVFVIGFGSGSTINAVLKHNPEKVTCSEISKEVIEAANIFSDVNENCLSDKRVKLIIEDAQSYLKLTNQKFDVIVSEPSNPWIAGIGNLFSKEYFQRCSEKLNEDGIMCQWFHIYEMDDEVLSLVLSTFNSVFPYVQTWGANQGDLILIGSKKPIKIDFKLLKERFENENVKSNINKIGIKNIFTFLTTQILSPEGTFTLTDDNKINSERKPTLEFLAPVAFYKGTTSAQVYQNDEKFDTLNSGLLVKDYISSNNVSDEELLQAIEFHFSKTKNHRLVYGLSRYILENGNKNLIALINKFLTEADLNLIKYNTKNLIDAFEQNPNSNQIAGFLANQMISENVNATNFMKVFSIDKAEQILKSHHRSSETNDFRFYTQLASIFLKNSEPQKAIEYCQKAEEILIKNPKLGDEFDLSDFYHTYALSAFYLDNYGKVIEYFIQLANYNQNYKPKKILSKRIEWKVREAKKFAR
ncbi:MAG: fused MFS/spermidine synthase [Ignavibacteria bacterium]|nr:fused MFS/spermidine synthase [Ignavibacteria bacterium]